MRVAPYLGDAVVGAEYCAEEGKLNPLLANQAVRRAFLAAGGAVWPEARVDLMKRGGNAWELHGGFGALRAGRVLLAAGAGTGALVAPLGLPVPTVAEPLHMNVTEAAAPLIHHLVQHAERMITLKQLAAGHVVIGGGWPAKLAGPCGHPTVEASSLLGNLRLASHIVPRLARLRLIRSWAGVNTTVDGRCVLGEAPGLPGLFFAVPGDAGYTLGPLVGRLAAGALRGRRDLPFDIEAFSAARFARSPAEASTQSSAAWMRTAASSSSLRKRVRNSCSETRDVGPQTLIAPTVTPPRPRRGTDSDRSPSSSSSSTIAHPWRRAWFTASTSLAFCVTVFGVRASGFAAASSRSAAADVNPARRTRPTEVQ